jgi:hypothetical protein
MQGKEVDMDKLVRQHELMPAVGNVRVNARGDELGPNGQIIRKHEDIIAEYYEANPKAKSDRPAVVPVMPKKTEDETKSEETNILKKSK